MKPWHLRWTARTTRPWMLAIGLWALAGCTTPIWRSQSPDFSDDGVAHESEPRLVGDYAEVNGLNSLRVEAVAMVTELNNTGSDPPPSPQRTELIREMQVRQAKNPNQLLAHPSTSLVLVMAVLPPGARKGDPIDIEVRVPSRSETTSLEGGWLMPVRLRELAVLGNAIRSGHERCKAQGPVLVESLSEGNDDPVMQTRGRVLAGGRILHDRPIGLFIRSQYHSVRTASAIGAAVNARFHTYDHGQKEGVATPLRDSMVELRVHPRYRHNITRFLHVVKAVPVRESSTERVQRLTLLGQQLLNPVTASRAAIELEAIGAEGIPVLVEALASENEEVRMYAAEALAYLNDERATVELAGAARGKSAFRWNALTALSTMDDIGAHDELSDCLHQSSAETRYGAFCALRAMNPHDPLVAGRAMGGEFYYHVIPTTGEPMIHVSRRRRPELVVFGSGLTITHPVVAFAGKHVLIKSTDDGQLKVCRFTPGGDDEIRYCTNRVDDLVAMIAEMGGGYAEVVQALREAADQQALNARIVFDAMPQTGRTYHRDGSDLVAPSGEGVSSPLPELFATYRRNDADAEEPFSEPYAPIEEPADAPRPRWDLFGKMKDRISR